MNSSTLLTTGTVARVGLSTEPWTSETARRARVAHPRAVVARRGLSHRGKFERAPAALGFLTEDFRCELKGGFTRG